MFHRPGFSALSVSTLSLSTLLLAAHPAFAQTYHAGAGLSLSAGNTFSIANGGVTGAMIGVPLSLTGASSSPILTVTNTGSGYGIKTVSTTGTGTYGTNTKYGNVGTLGDINGFGVYGSTAAGPYPYGVFGINRTLGNGDYGILGGVESLTGTNVPVGVYGSDSSGYGVLGSSTSGGGGYFTSNTGNGASGESAGGGYGLYGSSGTGTGVRGIGGGYGLYGSTNNGTGIYGISGSGEGMHGVSTSSNGVEGDSSSSSGVAGISTSGYGTFGGSTSGNGGYFRSQTGIGVSGVSFGAGDGLYGYSATGTAVYGNSPTATSGYFTGGGINGVYSATTASNGNGIEGVANSGTSAYGVYGVSSSGYGVVSNGAVAGVWGYSAAGKGVYAYSGGTSTVNPAIYDNNSNASGIGIYSVTNSSDANLVITNGGTGDLIKAFNGGNNLYFEVKANGTTIVRQLQITGGADLAEPYTIAAADGITPLPGMVVAIDPDHTGQMTLAHKAYDRTVAGIISGAGGIEPGLTLRQTGSVADGSLPVACSGRVWCFCDADAGGPITPGDLLAASSTPGHAMKASDDHPLRGAILGKAMSSLPSGKGLVLVLVTLE